MQFYDYLNSISFNVHELIKFDGNHDNNTCTRQSSLIHNAVFREAIVITGPVMYRTMCYTGEAEMTRLTILLPWSVIGYSPPPQNHLSTAERKLHANWTHLSVFIMSLFF